MKKYLYGILAVLALVLTGCEKKVTIDASLLIGTWSTPSKGESGGDLVFVFTNETCTVGGQNYGKWGYQYDEGDDVHLEDVLADKHKNNWFGYEVGDSKIILHNMGEFGYTGTTTNTVTAFSAKSMTMKDSGTSYIFTKQ